jgi:L-aminopeptidase/D-esterase-like protein
MRYLAERNIGFPTRIRNIPIVAAAVIFDLVFGQGESLPDHKTGYDACIAAGQGEIAQGNVGAGTGATVGKWSDFSGRMKGGFGLAEAQEGDLVVGAAAVTNCVGDILNADGSILAGARDEDGQWKARGDRWRRFPDQSPLSPGTNTTLVVIGTNAILDKVLANRLAERAHDGIAIAIRPAHTTHDGDTAYALATNHIEADFDLVANIAVEMVAEAIRNSVREASTVGPFVGLKE